MCVSVCICVSECIFMCGSVSVCVWTPPGVCGLSVSFNHSSSISLYESFYSPSSPTYLLLPCTARRSRVRFAVVGPAISPLPYLLEMFPLLVSWADSRAQRRDVLPWSSKTLIHWVNACILTSPNLLTNLVDCAQVRVVHQLHEVPVPKLLIGHGRPTSAAGV